MYQCKRYFENMLWGFHTSTTTCLRIILCCLPVPITLYQFWLLFSVNYCSSFYMLRVNINPHPLIKFSMNSTNRVLTSCCETFQQNMTNLFRIIISWMEIHWVLNQKCVYLDICPMFTVIMCWLSSLFFFLIRLS